ncbi:helix-turn-helix DNA binding domain protein [Gordonia phage Ligma]|nr:helix-turn-helix DNA binding domain protein [Gordonia phage Ligma]UQT02149.1 helix-turn-helix DNA binding domain protein [Gordonia phage Axumite]
MTTTDPVARAERIEAVARMTRQNMTAAEIAVRLGCTPRTVTRDRVRAGVANPTPCHPPETWERAQALLADGASYREAALTVGVDPSHLRRKYPGFGWTDGWPPGISPHDIARNRAS